MDTCTYNAARKVIASYLKPLCQNKYKIGNTQSFPFMLKQQAPLSLDEEYLLHDVDSLLANAPVDETICYIINKNHESNKLPQICSKMTLKR